MAMRWIKLGQLYVPRGNHPKLRSHAANPLPVHLKDNVYRVFFSGRDKDNRSSVGAVDIDIEKKIVVSEYEVPFFEYGSPGSFYDAGVSVGNCYVAGTQRYMLFMGWQNPSDGHWRGDIGRLRVTDSLRLESDSDVPLMGIDDIDPVSLSYPWVEQVEGGSFLMWYGSTITWDAGNGEMLHVINSAVSQDGHTWIRKGVSVPYQIGVAQAFSRPTVIRDQDGFHMWFSFRGGLGRTYRIGYAVSHDGQSWELRLQDAGIDVSATGWDSEMIEYPFVFDHAGQRYMLYNGNGYGKTGFGLAVLSNE
ncbi:hypothetical protein [Rhizobium sp. RU36D]|uniref:hypothetical protein n=1 Tax=Rhizobium sp. RU36D TaxID=1907415 RepID=UPI0009D91386|nr:hypothetical protein [Rhizobium sp. RU36D]SMD15962.1 hypothetical protein SAMN05880593_12862 [Rhizobium sp. RU36D]